MPKCPRQERQNKKQNNFENDGAKINDNGIFIFSSLYFILPDLNYCHAVVSTVVFGVLFAHFSSVKCVPTI